MRREGEGERERGREGERGEEEGGRREGDLEQILGQYGAK